MNTVEQRNDINEGECVRIQFNTLYSNRGFSLKDASLECGDINIDGPLSIGGNLTSRNIWIEDEELTVDGYLRAQGDIEAGNILISGYCNCLSIKSAGTVLIGSNCTCASIEANGDVVIDGTFSSSIDNINVPEGCHVYIKGELKR